MKRKISLVTLSACAALAGAGASAREPQQQQGQQVIASPNPTIDDSKTTAAEPDEITATKIQPATNTTAAPMKKATRPKRRQKSRQ
jgi:hypothetical protein